MGKQMDLKALLESKMGNIEPQESSKIAIETANLSVPRRQRSARYKYRHSSAQTRRSDPDKPPARFRRSQTAPPSPIHRCIGCAGCASARW